VSRTHLVAATLAVAVAVAVAGCGGPSDPVGLGPGVVTTNLGIHHSRFSANEIRVRPGTTVRFVLTNDDPILHELIVGPPEVHQRHEAGTEAAHAPRPGEVTIQPNTTAETTYDFPNAGSFEFTCHLPGHRAYGMTGRVVVSNA
jgi:uncharacterized cupredoxin-like copper-binding protein